MEVEETINIRFPVLFSAVYSTTRKVQRTETILEFFSSLSSFFNAIVANVVSELVEDGVMQDYENDVNNDDDSIVTRKFTRTFMSQIDKRVFGNHLLDDLGLNADEVKRAMKILSFNLVEDTLATCYTHICDEAADRGKRLSKVLALAAVDETVNERGLPTRFIIEATIALDSYRRISP